MFNGFLIDPDAKTVVPVSQSCWTDIRAAVGATFVRYLFPDESLCLCVDDGGHLYRAPNYFRLGNTVVAGRALLCGNNDGVPIDVELSESAVVSLVDWITPRAAMAAMSRRAAVFDARMTAPVFEIRHAFSARRLSSAGAQHATA